jgi:DNA alkylation damage repair protein AlkB
LIRQRTESEHEALRRFYPEYLHEEAEVKEICFHAVAPGLRVIINALPVCVQRRLVLNTIEDYIPPSSHLSNLDLHYTVPRPFEIFPVSEQNYKDIPHKVGGKRHTNLKQIRDKNLRWVTLGGQYDWTAKVYPSLTDVPEFPRPLADLIQGMFGVRAEAAIVNFYSPGDILSPHQDVAEHCGADLISISVGSTCVFYAGAQRYGVEPLAIILRSGDIVVMSGDGRWAWHGVGRVFAGTTPAYLEDVVSHPAYNAWIQGKRININVRQMT